MILKKLALVRVAILLQVLCLTCPVFTIAFFSNPRAIAQPIDRPPPTPTKPPETLPDPETFIPPPSSPPLPPEPRSQGTFTIQKYKVTGNTIFSEAEFDAVTREYTGENITFAEVVQARSAIAQLYLSQGYRTTGAYIPLQTMREGVLEIRVVEGKVSRIDVEGLQNLNTSYVRDRLSLAIAPPLNFTTLEEAIQLLQLDPRIARVSANLSEGVEPGENILNVEVKETPAIAGQIGSNNHRVPSVGSLQGQSSLTYANLLGWGDTVNFSYNLSQGSNLWEVGYNLPVNPLNGAVQLRYNQTSSAIIDPDFQILDIESRSHSFELGFRQPIARSLREEFALGLTFSHYDNQTFLQETPFPLTTGSERNGRTGLSALRFSQEWLKRSRTDAIAFRSQFNFGLDWFNATIHETAPDSDFFSWRGQFQWVHRLTSDLTLSLRSVLQLADRPLLGVEQLSLGGSSTVRGYRQDTLVADNGFFASIALQIPVLKIPEWESELYLSPFWDYGIVWNNSGGMELQQQTLSAIGVGLTWQISDRFLARLDWGIPLISVDRTSQTLQDNGLHFSLILNP
ncbi:MULTISPECIES: ShlB/FhaC/HecB family hemolysin secretion/activation protein [Spirulina sp. CCY15215]|uniref:ShlB/FhaC/HecB family hemolysin secretion/activation protein n=1 Tax=Spirulina sp. CCY15215 TaxID=2767591 RepID=UPI00195075A4|nr:ShlB/FhaC/HecB family hemolysin secretion/activation protein [Spirulina major]